MRCIAVSALLSLIPGFAFGHSSIQPKHHKRYSPNAKYFLDFNPETNFHSVYAVDSPDAPLWSFQSDAFWPYKQDESDGCLFVADDGASIAGLTWVHREGKPPDYRTFDGLEFRGPNGLLAAYRRSRLPAGRLPVLDIPVRIISFVFHGSRHRGRSLSRQGDSLHLSTFGMRSFTFSLSSGKIIGWNLNPTYFAYFAFVYAVPAWLIVRPMIRRKRAPAESTLVLRVGNVEFVVEDLGWFLVVLNSVCFVGGMGLQGFGGMLDQIGGTMFGITYPLAFVLVPVSFLTSAVGLISRPPRFSLVGPWLAMMSLLLIYAFTHAR